MTLVSDSCRFREAPILPINHHSGSRKKTVERELGCSRFSVQYLSQLKLLTETIRWHVFH